MDHFADTISAALKQPQTNANVQDTLKEMYTTAIAYLYHGEGDEMKGFFDECSKKIEFLFWTFQNSNEDYTDQHLLDIFEQFDAMKQKYDLSSATMSGNAGEKEAQYELECLL